MLGWFYDESVLQVKIRFREKRWKWNYRVWEWFGIQGCRVAARVGRRLLVSLMKVKGPCVYDPRELHPPFSLKFTR